MTGGEVSAYATVLAEEREDEWLRTAWLASRIPQQVWAKRPEVDPYALLGLEQARAAATQVDRTAESLSFWRDIVKETQGKGH